LKKLLLFLSVFLYANSNGLDSLLNNLEKESDLSKQTRKESLGHYIIFTREELDIMNVNRLSDILKYIPLSTSHKSRFGTTSISELGSSGAYPSSIKVFLNNKDLSSIYTGSPFLDYYNFPLTHIDHIEVYIAAAAVTIGNTPSSIIIKLYTKNPSREETSFINNGIGTTGFKNDFFTAKTVDENSEYLFLLTNSHYNYKNFNNLSSDANNQYLYANYKYKDSLFEISSNYTNLDPFMSLSKNSHPDNANIKNFNYYLTYTYNKKDLYKIYTSFSHTNRKYYETNLESGIFTPLNENNVTWYNENRNLEKFNVMVSKNFELKNDKLFTAISFQNLNNHINSLKYSTNGSNVKQDGKDKLKIHNLHIYSAMLENKFNINDRNLIFASLKDDYYKSEANYKENNSYIARLGYISLINNFKIKTFLTKSYMPVNFMQQEFASKSLKQPKGRVASAEIDYKNNNNFYSFLIGRAIMKNMITYTPYGAINIDKTLYATFFNVGYTYNFSLFNKLVTNYSRTFTKQKISSPQKVSSMLFYNYKNYDFFSGLVYYSGYESYNVKVKHSFNADIGVTYNMNKFITFSLKGKNIFNDSLKEVYVTSNEKGSYPDENQDFSFEVKVSF